MRHLKAKIMEKLADLKIQTRAASKIAGRPVTLPALLRIELLLDRIEHGEISIHEAYRLLTGRVRYVG